MVTQLILTLLLHPLHTTLTELAYRDTDHSVIMTVRVFADDFARATGAQPAHAYVQRALTLADRNGRVVPLTWVGARQTGNVLWITLRAPAPAGKLQLRNQILCDVYADQVNIVQITVAANRKSLLYTRGDGFKLVD